VLQQYLEASNLSDEDYLFKSRKGDHPLNIQAVNAMDQEMDSFNPSEGNYGAHSLRKTWGYIQRINYGVGFEVIAKDSIIRVQR